jgi:hypothetical protein
MYNDPDDDPSTFEEGDIVYQVCRDATGAMVFTDEVVWGSDPPVEPVPPEVLAEHARADLVLPLPAPRTWPAIDVAQTVGLATWLHVDNFIADTRTASAGAVSATVHADPQSVRWNMGDGTVVDCTTAGTIWGDAEQSDCTHVFDRRSSTNADGVFHGNVTITWHLWWDSTTGAGADLGTVIRTTPIDWTVRELQALIQ